MSSTSSNIHEEEKNRTWSALFFMAASLMILTLIFQRASSDKEVISSYYFHLLNFDLSLQYKILWVVSAGLMLLYKPTRWVGGVLGLAFSFRSVIIFYSAEGAFNQIRIVLFLFILFFYNSKYAGSAARFFTSALFINSGLEKMNIYYLHGSEFRGGSFAQATLAYHPFMRGLLLDLANSHVFLVLSIVAEILIGLSLLFVFPLGAILTLIFVCMLSVIQPAVLYVFAVLAPFLYISGSKYFRDFNKSRVQILWAGILYFALLVVGKYRWQTFDRVNHTQEFILDLIVVVAHLGFGLFFMQKMFSRKVIASAWDEALGNLHQLRVNIPIFLWTIGIISYMMLPYFRILPVPYGFSMFSSRSEFQPMITLHIPDGGKCTQLSQQYEWGRWETGFWSQPDGSCTLRLPSRSALEHFKAIK